MRISVDITCKESSRKTTDFLVIPPPPDITGSCCFDGFIIKHVGWTKVGDIAKHRRANTSGVLIIQGFNVRNGGIKKNDGI